MEKFFNFIKTLKNDSNNRLLETVETAFKLIFEAPSSDDANKHPQTVGTSGPPANAISFDPNEGNEWFPQTLPNEKLKHVKHAQTGGNKYKLYPTMGKGVITLDPNKSGQGRNDNTYGAEGPYAGNSNTGSLDSLGS